MTIGIDASRANALQHTGTEWYSYYLIQALKNIVDPNDRVVLYSKETLRDGLEKLPSNWESRVLAWPPKKLWTQLRFSLQMLKDKLDVLFVPAHTIPLIHPKNVVTTIHDLGFIRHPELYQKSELSYHRISLRLAVNRAKHIIAVSNFTKRELIDLCGCDPAKITVIYHGVDQTRYHMNHQKEKIQNVLHKYNIREPYIFFVGRLEKKKNIQGLIQAFEILKNIKIQEYKNITLVLAGRAGFGFKETEKLINWQTDKLIKVLGFVPEEDVPYLMAGAELFVFPSLYEGFGMPLLQATATGTPIVASRAASIPEVVGEAGVLADPHSPEALAAAINLVLTDAVLRKTLTDKGLERVKQFSWEKCARETLQVLKEPYVSH